MKILWSSNAPWSTSGYGQQTALTLPRLKSLGHDIAINCFFGLEGAAIEWNGFPCYPTDHSRFGNLMLGDYAAHHAGARQNCLVMTLMDVWVMMQGLPNFSDLKFACWTPVDHDPAPPMVIDFLRRSNARVIAMSRFGERELERHGFDPMYAPHAIDTTVFSPQPDLGLSSREKLGISPDTFVVGMVAMNQGIPSRKSFPQLFEAFAAFHARHPDSMLYIHGDVVGRNNGIELNALASACGIPNDASRATDYLGLHIGLPQQTVAAIYNMFDVLAIPSMGEGFGIPLIEAQACGVPVITTDWTAMPELCGSGWLVDGDRWYDGTQRSFYKLPAVSEIDAALESAYQKARDPGVKQKARVFAEQYDVDRVFEECWVPIMADLEKPREVAPLPLKVAA